MTTCSPVRRSLLAFAFMLTSLAPAMALEQKPYDAAEFKAAQQAGKAIVVHVTAGWCPTCKAQHAAIDTLAKDPAYANVTIYDVDFDKEPSVWKGFGAQQQSTLIGYAGSKETARSVGETSPEALASVLQSTLK